VALVLYEQLENYMQRVDDIPSRNNNKNIFPSSLIGIFQI
jgi:hypothetical protein